MTRETEPVMGEALRLFVFLFSLLGSLMGGGGVEKEEGYTKYGGKEDDGVPRGWRRRKEGTSRQGGELGERDGMRNSRWLSLRCLYTRGSCMAVGHISVSRERGAPPKNQIECKNRINSSWRVERAMSAQFAFVRTPPPPSLFGPAVLSLSFAHAIFFSLSLSLSVFAVRATRPSRARMTPPRRERPITSHISSYSACPPRSRVMRFAALMKDPLFIDNQSHGVRYPYPMSCNRGEGGGSTAK